MSACLTRPRFALSVLFAAGAALVFAPQPGV
ncbi:MAG: hypothetical protein ACI9OJ_005235, partial [Myxococcota bacterium]